MNIKKDLVIQLSRVTKEYVIHHEKPTLVEKLFKGKEEKFLALKNINLTIKKGESVGIIGDNGSGKTTLLKVITGITTPTRGKVNTMGKVISLIDLEAGFHPDLTGIQNIYLNGAIIGIRKKEIDAMIDKIVQFAGIGKFIDSPLFTYSQGMKLRLGFSIAIHAEPDILILDENISVGDQEFNKTSNKKVRELFKKNKTIIIASHDMGFIQSNCKSVCWLDRGKLKEFGAAGNVIKRYKKSAVK